ncbi:unnamed protein product [Lactuca virosa]|uniref:MMS19 nucleotide excision repair protein n=1 Tax=Lactuca virosa TaxID=75947 RepID=A0AAU9M938_9ASTR|nr:unnamed protein product [Lactuca virosa]
MDMLRGESVVDAQSLACFFYILRVGVIDQVTEPTKRVFLVNLGKQVLVEFKEVLDDTAVAAMSNSSPLVELDSLSEQATVLVALASVSPNLPRGYPARTMLDVARKMITEASRNHVVATFEKEAGWLLLSSLLSSMPKEEMEDQVFDILLLGADVFSGRGQQPQADSSEYISSKIRLYRAQGMYSTSSIVRQHIRKYLPELLSLISELWSSFSLPAANRLVHGPPILHLVEQLCLALNDEFGRYLPIILPCFIQVMSDAERCNDCTYVRDILCTLKVFGGTLDEKMHILLPALIGLFKVDASVDIRLAAIKTLIRLIPPVQLNEFFLGL